MASPLGEDSSPPLFVSPLVPGRLALSLDGPITQQSNDEKVLNSMGSAADPAGFSKQQHVLLFCRT